MTVTVCLCDKGGMLFNKRRQSRDSVLIKDFLSLNENEKIFISPFSEKLFLDFADLVTVSENPLADALGGVLFAENLALSSVADKIDKMIVYRWNRSYPADFYLDTPPDKIGLKLLSSMDFEGSSHEKITREIWVK